MKRRRSYYIDPLWLAFLLVGVSLGLLLSVFHKSAEAKEIVLVKEVPVEKTVYVEAPAREVEVSEVFYAEPVTYERGTDGDLDLLALVIYQEAGGDAQSDETRQMVGEVALNRVADDRYPNTLHGVLTQRGQYGRLHWTGIQWPERAENPGEQEAVQRAYRIAEDLLVGGCERLLPEDVIFQAEFVQGSEIVAEAPGFYFCR